jgi:hypothetical protein
MNLDQKRAALQYNMIGQALYEEPMIRTERMSGMQFFFVFFFQTRGNSLRLTGSEKYTNARDSDAYSATVDMRR